MRRRMGYAEAEYRAVMARKKKEIRKQKALVFGTCAIFGGLVFWIYWGLWAWANGYIGG